MHLWAPPAQPGFHQVAAVALKQIWMPFSRTHGIVQRIACAASRTHPSGLLVLYTGSQGQAREDEASDAAQLSGAMYLDLYMHADHGRPRCPQG